MRKADIKWLLKLRFDIGFPFILIRDMFDDEKFRSDLFHPLKIVLTLANTSAGDWLGWVTIISFLAIVTVSSWKWKRDYVWIIFSPLHRKSPIQTCGKVSTGQTHASRLSSRKFVQFHVESTSSCMTVTVAHWNKPKKKKLILKNHWRKNV